MRWEVNDVTELSVVAKVVLDEIKKVDGGAAAVLALHGDLGSGKTTFMQTLAKELGVTEAVTSPTFVVMKNYTLLDQHWVNLVHIDAYRIEEVDEMRPLRFADLLSEKDTIICIEWAEKITELLPANTLHLSFTIEGGGRRIELTSNA